IAGHHCARAHQCSASDSNIWKDDGGPTDIAVVIEYHGAQLDRAMRKWRIGKHVGVLTRKNPDPGADSDIATDADPACAVEHALLPNPGSVANRHFVHVVR